jgi:hypothetical protein
MHSGCSVGGVVYATGTVVNLVSTDFALLSAPKIYKYEVGTYGTYAHHVY